MDSRTVKSISEAAGYAARYDTKIKIWQVSKDGAQPFTFTSVQLDKMTPDALRRKLGVKPEKKAKKSKPKTERKPRAAFDPEANINLLVTENPKRGGSAVRYALYKDGMTVAEYIAAGGTPDDLRWDAAHKYISVLTG